MGKERGGKKSIQKEQRLKKPQVLEGNWAQAEGGKGGRTDTGHDDRNSNMILGAETSGRGWWAEGGG